MLKNMFSHLNDVLIKIPKAHQLLCSVEDKLQKCIISQTNIDAMLAMPTLQGKSLMSRSVYEELNKFSKWLRLQRVLILMCF